MACLSHPRDIVQKELDTVVGRTTLKLRHNNQSIPVIITKAKDVSDDCPMHYFNIESPVKKGKHWHLGNGRLLMNPYTETATIDFVRNDSPVHVSGIANILYQALIEVALAHNPKKIELHSVNGYGDKNPAVSHYKRGFRAQESEANEALKQCLEDGREYEGNPPTLYLFPNKQAEYKQKKPLLSDYDPTSEVEEYVDLGMKIREQISAEIAEEIKNLNL